MKSLQKNKDKKRYHQSRRGDNPSNFFHSVNIVLFSVFVLVGFYYLISANDLVVKGVVMQGLKNQAKNLDEDKRAYENKILALQSYGSLKARVQSLDMVAVGNVDYLTIKAPALAMK
ncbi:MAG: hypothetical protein NT165_03090 [Candidatus Falkowbacteria bacterium]|nr:hypothetical protein [Candidatus Falkowbacteria bacterium]